MKDFFNSRLFYTCDIFCPLDYNTFMLLPVKVSYFFLSLFRLEFHDITSRIRLIFSDITYYLYGGWLEC